MNRPKFIPFNVEWKVESSEDSLNIGDEEEDYIEGVIYWREDIIIGFNTGEEPDECFLITGLSHTGERLQFRVKEDITEVARKLNDGKD